MDEMLFLTDLIDISILQEMQDSFSKMTGIAAYITDAHGNYVTETSRQSDFCTVYTRTSEEGARRCKTCDYNSSRLAFTNSQTITYHCHAGLRNFAAPIIVEGRLAGCFFAGQFLDAPPDDSKIRRLAEEIGTDPAEYARAYQRIPLITRDKMKRASLFLRTITTALSSIAYHNFVILQENAKIKRATSLKSDFLANMSHEIRTPINAVLGMDEMILRESRDEKILEYAADIKRAGNTLLCLINDILDFSKIESGKMDIIPVEYDLGLILNELLAMVRSRAEKKNLILEAVIEPETPAHLYGDEVRIRQIITNILTNAVKYTPQGRITLNVSGEVTKDDRVRLYISVKDTGMGIREEDKKKLFDSFQRVDESRNRNIEGTGLGLSITMQLLELMGSRLEVKSTYGKGSDFYFYLEQEKLDSKVIGDFQKNYAKQNEKLPVYIEKFTAPLAKILVVDDNEMNRKVFLGLLKNLKMQIDTAACGKDSLELIKQKEYHIIFMDYLMPEMNGVETLQQAEKLSDSKCKNSVFVALTANAVSGAGEMFLENGFDDFLSKPIIATKLEEMIQKYLPKELIEAPVEKKETVIQTKDEKPKGNTKEKIKEESPVDWKVGRELCMNDEAFYREMLGVFLESNAVTELEKFYHTKDFENYQIKIHAAKTNLMNIGAKKSAELAKKMELSLKRGEGLSYVQEHHKEFLFMYDKVVLSVKEYLENI